LREHSGVRVSLIEFNRRPSGGKTQSDPYGQRRGVRSRREGRERIEMCDIGDSAERYNPRCMFGSSIEQRGRRCFRYGAEAAQIIRVGHHESIGRSVQLASDPLEAEVIAIGFHNRPYERSRPLLPCLQIVPERCSIE
jgi:hypothetical protein